MAFAKPYTLNPKPKPYSPLSLSLSLSVARSFPPSLPPPLVLFLPPTLPGRAFLLVVRSANPNPLSLNPEPLTLNRDLDGTVQQALKP